MTAVTDNQLEIRADTTPTSVSLPGFQLHPGTLAQYLNLIERSIQSNQTCTVLYHNLHTLYAYFRSETLRAYYQNAIVLVDGMPLIALLRLGGFRASREHRLTYVDFIQPMMELARDNGWHVYHVGQSADVQNAALDRLKQRVPGLHITGHDGYFDVSPDSPQSQQLVQNINDSQAQLVLIGLGTPLQERWIAAHRHCLKAPAVLACGACMEYVAGAVPVPPRWLGRLGLEWTSRLASNPRRFAFRYLVEPIVLAGFLLRHWVQSRTSQGVTDYRDGHR